MVQWMKIRLFLMQIQGFIDPWQLNRASTTKILQDLINKVNYTRLDMVYQMYQVSRIVFNSPLDSEITCLILKWWLYLNNTKTFQWGLLKKWCLNFKQQHNPNITSLLISNLSFNSHSKWLFHRLACKVHNPNNFQVHSTVGLASWVATSNLKSLWPTHKISNLKTPLQTRSIHQLTYSNECYLNQLVTPNKPN